MHYERRVKDDERALEFAQLALAELRKAKLLSTRMPAGHFAGAFAGAMALRTGAARESRLEKGLMKRVARLERRIGVRRGPTRLLSALAVEQTMPQGK